MEISNRKSWINLCGWLSLGVMSVALPFALKGFRKSHIPFLSLDKSVLPLQINVLGIAVSSGGLIYCHGKRLVFEGSLGYKVWQGDAFEWGSEIPIKGTPGIILSALPLDRHLKELKGKVQAVLSCVEPWELQPGWLWFLTPITRQKWENERITAEHISVPDHYPLKPEQLHFAADFIHKQHQKGKKVLVHCKGGKGRSAMAVIAYLIKYHNMSLTDAFHKVKGCRSVVAPNGSQWKALKAFTP